METTKEEVVNALIAILDELEEMGLSTMSGDTFSGLVACCENARDVLSQ